MDKVTLYHVNDGPFVFTSVSADEALRFPAEWARTPWPKKAEASKAEPPVEPGEASDELVLKHRGRGSYSIMRGEVEVVDGLTKDEGEAKLAEMLAA